jgi:hypothetical protein
MEETLLVLGGMVAGAVLIPVVVRPVLLGMVTTGYKFADVVASMAAAQRKNIEGLLAEARNRARMAPAPQAQAKA